MNAPQKLLLALAVAASAPAANAATLYFSGYVSAINISTPGGFSANPLSTGMLVTGTFEFDPAAAASSYFGVSSYDTGRLTMTINSTMHLSTNAPGPSNFPSIAVQNNTSQPDVVEFHAGTYEALSSDFLPIAQSGAMPSTQAATLSLKTANANGLNTTALPSAAMLASNLFTSRTITVTLDSGIEQPCGDDFTDFCFAPNSYGFVTQITSVSQVPLPPSLLLTGSSLALLALGKRQRRNA